MKIYYNGVDITDDVSAQKCIVHDRGGEKCDSLDITFENASAWLAWKPKEDDTISVTHEGYESGTMYVNALRPDEGAYRIVATSLPSNARAKHTRSFIGKSLEAIMSWCANASGMGYEFYGVNKNVVIPYILMEDETCAAFLHRLLNYEGAELKIINRSYVAIDIMWAQAQETQKAVVVDPDRIMYMLYGFKKRGIIVRSPGIEGRAYDNNVDAGHVVEEKYLPVSNVIQASRWARGLLIDSNRKCESVIFKTDFNPFTSLMPVSVMCGRDIDGSYLIDDVTHDLINGSTMVSSYRALIL